MRGRESGRRRVIRELAGRAGRGGESARFARARRASLEGMGSGERFEG